MGHRPGVVTHRRDEDRWPDAVPAARATMVTSRGVRAGLAGSTPTREGRRGVAARTHFRVASSRIRSTISLTASCVSLEVGPRSHASWANQIRLAPIVLTKPVFVAGSLWVA